MARVLPFSLARLGVRRRRSAGQPAKQESEMKRGNLMRIRASYFAAARFIAVSISATLVFILAHNNTAHAVPITYDFTATAAGGPLNGDVFSGTLSADSTVVAAGNGNVTLVSFDLLGTVFTQSEGVFGLVPSATFNAAGDLTSLANFVVISNARAADLGIGGGVFIPSPVTSFNFDGNFNYGTDPTQGENFGLGAVSVHLPCPPCPSRSASLFSAVACWGSP